MMKNIWNLSFCVSCLIFSLELANAQLPSQRMPSFTTPNAAGFELLTKVPISQFTGSPNISIPIYTIEDGSFNVPISLRYHASSVRVHSHPGWVGLGWSLMAGGQINRTVNGNMDEWKGKLIGDPETGFYYSFAKLAGNDAEWNSEARMKQYASEYLPGSLAAYEAMPDEFSFSFLGYSGKFFWTHEGKWKVISDDEIKVEFDPTLGIGMIAENGLRGNILDRINAYGNIDEKSVWTNRYFNKFTLVTPDGARYEFGGINATEYTVPYLSQDVKNPIPVTWYLAKIISPSGGEINFDYEPGELITSLTQRIFFSQSERESGPFVFGLEPGCWTNVPLDADAGRIDGVIMFPVYLSSITYPKGNVKFKRISINQELRWPTDEMIDSDLGNTPSQKTLPVYFRPHIPGEPTYGYGKQRGWPQLTNIEINDYAYPGDPKTKLFSLVHSLNTSERLKLLSIQESSGDMSAKMPPHIFTYNTTRLPSYSDIKSNDHWDFYNGFDQVNFPKATEGIEQYSQKFYTAREPDVSGFYGKAEILEQIQYPTGGAVKFECEPHTYSKVVDREDNLLRLIELPSNKVAGGLRIKRILHFNSVSQIQPSLIKEYFYAKDFSLNSTLSSLKSSGILGGYPKYYWPNYTAKDISGVSYKYSVFSSGAVLPFGINSEGSHVGYSEVVEVSKNVDGSTNGYTKYRFSNFDQDIWGVPHPDEIGYSLDPNRSVFSPYTSNDNQRGKLQAEEHFNASDLPVEITRLRYAITANGYVRRVLQEPFDVCTASTAGAQTCFVTAYKSYINRYNLVQKDVLRFSYANSLSITETFEYNAQNLLSRKTQTSNGSFLETIIKYPLDYTSVPSITSGDLESIGIGKLIQKNILNRPIEVIEMKNNQIKEGRLTIYKTFANNVFPHKEFKFESNKLLPIGSALSSQSVTDDSDYFNPASLFLDNGNYIFRKDRLYSQQPIVYDQYDSKGNVREIFKANDLVKCYVWGYKKSLPVAEILGATLVEVAALGVDLDDLSNQAYTDEVMRSKIAIIRNGLPRAQVTGYTYNAFGITSKVDPSGRIIYYVYDKLGKLIFIKDIDGNILQALEYNYSAGK